MKDRKWVAIDWRTTQDSEPGPVAGELFGRLLERVPAVRHAALVPRRIDPSPGPVAASSWQPWGPRFPSSPARLDQPWPRNLTHARSPEVGRPYYKAETTLQVLDLLEAPKSGSTSWKWWTRSQPIRTIAQLPFEFPVLDTRQPFAYQLIAEKALQLKRLGVSAGAIAQALGVTDKTVAKAIRFAREHPPSTTAALLGKCFREITSIMVCCLYEAPKVLEKMT